MPVNTLKPETEGNCSGKTHSTLFTDWPRTRRVVRLSRARRGFWIVLPARGEANIVHIVADDLGWMDVGFDGCADIKTPNTDKLAAGGAEFSQSYVQPMCTPTRAALMTGRYPFGYRLQTAVIPSVSAYGLDTTEWLMPQCRRRARVRSLRVGYRRDQIAARSQ